MKLVRIGLLGWAVAVSVAGSSALSAHPRGKFVSIGTRPGDTGSAGLAINARGHVAGFSNDATAAPHAVLWDGRALRALPELPGDTFSMALALNSHDEVVGAHWDSGSIQHAMQWKNGVAMPLPELPDTSSSIAAGVNDAGVIVGSVTTHGAGTLPVLWVRGTVHTLPGGIVFAPAAINRQGQIACNAQDISGHPAAFTWYHLTLKELFVPDPDTLLSNANGINAGGAVVGYIVDSVGQHAAVWKGNHLSLLARLPGDNGAIANAINDRGDVVGSSYHGSPLSPVMWPGGKKPIALNSQLPAGIGYTITNATAINARRQITGVATSGSDSVGFVLTP